MEAGDADRLCRRLVGTSCRKGGVASAVELRTWVVGHAAVDRDPGQPVEPLDRPHAVEGDSCLPHERPPGLEGELRCWEIVRPPGVRDRVRDSTRELPEVRVRLVEDVTDGEATADVHQPWRPGQLTAAACRKRREERDGLRVGGGVRELGPDVDVEACDVEAERPSGVDRS